MWVSILQVWNQMAKRNSFTWYVWTVCYGGMRYEHKIPHYRSSRRLLALYAARSLAPGRHHALLGPADWRTSTAVVKTYCACLVQAIPCNADFASRSPAFPCNQKAFCLVPEYCFKAILLQCRHLPFHFRCSLVGGNWVLLLGPPIFYVSRSV
jgi:hypothetical protein